LFQFDAFSEDACCFNMTFVTSDGRKYSTPVHLSGGDFWQRVRLSNKNFKSETGRPLDGFTGLELCELSDCAGVIFNNILWI
jgi:hypothetical protein